MRRETLRRLFETLEREQEMLHVLQDVSSAQGELAVTIGGEHPSTGEWEASIITAPFKTGDTDDRHDRRGGPDAHGLPERDGVGARGREAPLRARDGARPVAHGARPRSVRGPRGLPRRERRGDQEGLPAARARAPSRRERRPGGRGALQGGRGRLRDPLRPREAPALRRLRADGRSGRRPRGSPTSRTSSTCSSAAGSRRRRARAGRGHALSTARTWACASR